LGVDLGSLTGTGNHGMIRTAEVLAAARQVGTPLERTAGRTAEPSEPPSDREVMASPRARHLAKEHGVELADVQPSGEDGTISGEDVERHLASVTAATAPGLPTPPPAAVPGAEAAPSALEPAPPGQAPPPTSSVPPAGEADRVAARRLAMRQAIADLMARSKREIPHYYLSQLIDMTRALEWLEAENLARSVADRLLPATLLVKAVARSLVEVPEMNGFWIDDRFVPGEGIHTGIAISLREGGLVAPAIHDADRKTLDELMQALRDLVARARKGVLQRAEMSDPTITVTNLGDQGVDAVYGVIYPPQVALVGFGTVAERPWAQSGMVGVRRLLTATLSADHRASDGHRGGIFLAAIDRWLQEPEQL
jgi:pyruvate dehydrogenase E2 component (dihydrolipoamide acetyltransferase)